MRVLVRGVALGALAASAACSLMDLSDLHTGAEAGGDDASPDVAGPVLVPAEGVYTYQDNLRSGTTSGSEIVSINAGAATSSSFDNPIFPGTVQHVSPGCWSITLEPVATSTTQGHVEIREFCAVNGALVDQSPATQISRYTFGNSTTTATTELTCGQNCVSLWPSPDAGSSNVHTCQGSTPVISSNVLFASSGTYDFVGYQDVTIGVQVISAFHATIHRVITPLSGQDGGFSISGTDDSEYWFDPATGMLVRWKRNVSLTTSIPPFGAVDYEERSDWLLTGMQPLPLPDAGVDASDADAGDDASIDASGDAPKDAPGDAPKDGPKDAPAQ
jgi:hypothetical protein